MTLVKRMTYMITAISFVASSSFAVGTKNSAPSGEYDFYETSNKSAPRINIIEDSKKGPLSASLLKTLNEVQAATRQKGFTLGEKAPGKLKAAGIHTIKSLGPESLYFFMGMGAVAFWQIWTDSAQNPVSLQQHIEHQLSPMGVLGFGVFMYANNLTSTTLQTMIKNPSFMKFLPFLGMTAGFTAQSIFSHFFSDPNVLACALKGKITAEDKERGIDENPCQKAAENFEDLRLAPSLTSMLISTYLAGKLEAGFKGVAQRAVYKLSGFDLALFLAPGTTQIRGVRAVIKGIGKTAQITTFVAIDAWLNRVVTYGWKNFFDGGDFNGLNADIVSQINFLKARNWVPEADQVPKNYWEQRLARTTGRPMDLLSQLKHFQKRMSDWRMTNMADIYEAHMNWQTALNQLTGMYSASSGFYADIINEIRSAKFTEAPKKLEMIYPFAGVKAFNLAEERYDRAITHPALFKSYQRETMTIAAILLGPKAPRLRADATEEELAIQAQLAGEAQQLVAKTTNSIKSTMRAVWNAKNKVADDHQEDQFRTEDFISPLASNITEESKSIYVDILGKRNELTKNESSLLQKMANLIASEDENKAIEGLLLLKSEYQRSLRLQENAYAEILATVMKIVGSPAPQLEPGRGYMTALQASPKGMSLFAGINYYRSVGMISTPLTVDYLLMQMICGPDVDQPGKSSMIKSSVGFPSIFRAPQIRNGKDDFQVECQGMTAPNSNVMDTRLYNLPFKKAGVQYVGFLDYLSKSLRPSVMGDESGSNFTNWWKDNTTQQMEAAFADFGVQYEKIVVNLVRALFYQHKDGAYSTKVFNKLGLNQDGKNSLNYGPLYNSPVTTIFQEERLYLSILKELMEPSARYGYYLISAMENEVQQPELKKVEESFIGLANMLKEIRIIQKDGRERIESRLTNKDFKSQKETIEKVILGLKDSAAISNLPAYKKEVAHGVLEALVTLANELESYGAMANAVSWQNLYDEGSLTATQHQMSDEAQRKIKASGSMTGK